MEKKNRVHHTKENKKWISQLLSLGVVISFFFIKISYNSTKPITVLEYLRTTIKELNFEDLFSINQDITLNLSWLAIIILVNSIGLILSSLMNKKKGIVFFLLFFLLIWFYAFNTYYSMIEIRLFFESSIFFILFNISSFFFLAPSIDHKGSLY